MRANRNITVYVAITDTLCPTTKNKLNYHTNNRQNGVVTRSEMLSVLTNNNEGDMHEVSYGLRYCNLEGLVL